MTLSTNPTRRDLLGLGALGLLPGFNTQTTPAGDPPQAQTASGHHLVLQAKHAPRMALGNQAMQHAQYYETGRFIDLHALQGLVQAEGLRSLSAMLDAANHLLAIEFVRSARGRITLDERIKDTAGRHWYQLAAHWPLIAP